MFQTTVWSIPPLAAALVAIIAYSRAANRAHVPGGSALRFLFICIACWAGPQAPETFLVTEQSKPLANQMAYVGITLTPIAWFQFAITYSQRVLRISRTLQNSVAAIPMVTLILAFTNSWHGLIWQDWAVVSSGGYVGLVTEHGWWFYVHASYSYALLLASTAILGFALTHYQQHAKAMLAAIGAPLIGALCNLFYLSPFNPSPWLDLTTLGFLIGVFLLDRGILQHGLLNRIPVARDRVVENLKDPVVVVTHDGVIADVNQSAIAAWGGDETLLDRPVSDLVEHLPLDHLLNVKENSEVTIAERSFEISSTSLDSANPKAEVALVFRDVTERQRQERKLREMKDELERMAHTDALTNLFNRRYFMQRLGEEFERVKRHNSTLSVLIFDLDHFKRINDGYGHDIGDAVLVAVSNVANQVKRITDVACRLGGEEFALLLPETDKEGAIQLAHRLRHGIADFPYPELIKRPLKVTASVGVATVTQKSPQPEDILKIADRALYDAKNGGRNMVCFNAA